jgi:hypothetical protein
MTVPGRRSAFRRARRAVVLLAVSGLVMAGLDGCSRAPQALKPGQCKAGDPLAGVYLPSRLTVKSACTTVTGTVDCVQSELDGDVHIRLRPDPAYRRLLTAANAFQQCPSEKDPHLVVEIIPQVGHDGFKDNSAAKAGFVTPLAPIAGQHVTVTGPLVWDTNLLHDLVYPGHNVRDWAEIHPAWNVTIDHLPPARASP